MRSRRVSTVHQFQNLHFNPPFQLRRESSPRMGPTQQQLHPPTQSRSESLSPQSPQVAAPLRSNTFHARVDRLCLDGIIELTAADNRSTRIVWTILIIVAVSMGIYQCILTVDTYRQSPIVTTTQIVLNDQLKFPDIYVCPMNAIDKTKALTDEYIDLAKQFLTAGQSLTVNETGILHQMVQNTDVESAFAGFKLPIHTLFAVVHTTPPPPPNKAQALFERIAYRKSIFISECSFSNRPQSCSLESFVERFDNDYGRCFLLPGVRLPNQTAAGHGLSLVVDIRRDLYPDRYRPTMDGIRIWASHDFDPTMDKTAGGVFAQPGHLTDITLSATRYRLINIDTGIVEQKCQNVDDPQKARQFKYSNVSYSVTACRRECIQEIVYAECGCLLPFDSRDQGDRFTENDQCTINATTECVYKNVLKTNRTEIGLCTRKCIMPCTSREIDYRSSSLPLTDKFQDQNQNENIVHKPSAAARPTQKPASKPHIATTSHSPTSTTKVNTVHSSARLRKRAIHNVSTSTTTESPIIFHPIPYPDSDSDSDSGTDSGTDLAETTEEKKRQFKDAVVIRVAFGELRYMEIIQSQSMTFDTMVGNIGGQLGLWIGASIISVVQLISLIIHWCHARLLNRRKRKEAKMDPAPPTKQVLYINDVHVN